MAKHDNIKAGFKNITRLKVLMILGYAFIIIISIVVVSVLAVRKTDTVLKNKVSTMSSSLNVQMKLNLDSYLSRMETIGALAFGSEEAYTYDATDPDNDEYEALATEKVISDKLYSLCIMENFVDYGIVYSNNRTVGKISNGTVTLFGDQIYTDLSSMISRQKTRDGWETGYKDDFKRIYYVKRIHDNAILVISFYATELENVFDNPETMKETVIRLVDKNHNIIYSSEKDEVGTHISGSLEERIGSHDSATVMDNEYLVTVNSCGDDWYVICSIPTQIILSEKNEMRYYIYMIAFIASVLAVLVGIELSFKLTAPVSSAFSYLDLKAQIDQLTGILNKKAFEDYTENRIDNALPIESHALILIDLDNFKGVNDTLGHAYGDQVLAKIGSILRGCFSSEDYLGRIGGDEFCVFLNQSPDDDTAYEEFVSARCEQICEAFRSNYTGDDGKYKISGSLGIALFPKDGNSFAELYHASDKALYVSKKCGKDTYSFYEPSMDKEADDT